MTPTKPRRRSRRAEDRPSTRAEKPFIRSEEERFARADDRYPFGPTFFRKQLRAFLRDEAAEPTDVLPVVEIHLGDRHPLDLAHIINVTPEWVAVAVRDTSDGPTSTRLRTEFLPYDAITRVTLLPVRPFASQLGFDRARMAGVLSAPARPTMSPAAAMRTAAGDETVAEAEGEEGQTEAEAQRERPAGGRSRPKSRR